MTTVYHVHSGQTSPTPVTLENIDRVAVGCVDWTLARGPTSSYNKQDMASIEVWFDVLTDEQVSSNKNKVKIIFWNFSNVNSRLPPSTTAAQPSG